MTWLHVIEGSGLPIIQAAPANQNAASDILQEKLEDLPPIIQAAPANQNAASDILQEKLEDQLPIPCLPDKLKHSKRVDHEQVDSKQNK